jgi:predicted amidophosphoribosyltransferase
MQRAEQRSFLVAPLLTVVRSIFSIAFPSDCRICSLSLTNSSRLPVCEQCADSIEPIRERGCNQAELMVRSRAKYLPGRLEIGTLLKRQRATHSQVGLPREERIANMRGAFRVTDPERVKDRTVIVVDDVMTTGTTVPECARVLKKAGSERVWAATVARTLKEAALPVSDERGKEEESEAAEMAVSV